MTFFKIVKIIRDRYHPLWHLRKYKLFHFFQRYLDIEIFCNFYKVNWKVCVRLIRNMSTILMSGICEPGVTSLFLAINKTIKPKCFWDIGASIGYYSWLFKSCDSNIYIVLFEPDPENVRLLKKTIVNAQLNDVKLIEKAVADKIEKTSFIVDDISGVAGTLEVSLINPHQNSIHRWLNLSKRITVETVTLNALKDEIVPPDIMKIDVEASEEKVFDGGLDLIKKHKPIIIFEAKSLNKHKLFATFQNFDYSIYNADNIDGDIFNALNLFAFPNSYRNIKEELFRIWRNEFKMIEKI